MARVISPKTILTHRNVLIALIRYLVQERTGGVMGSTIQTLVRLEDYNLLVEPVVDGSRHDFGPAKKISPLVTEGFFCVYKRRARGKPMGITSIAKTNKGQE